METQQLEYDFTNTPAFVLKLTGNPWTDFGIVSFCRALEHSHFIEALNLTAYEAILTIQPDAHDNFNEKTRL